MIEEDRVGRTIWTKPVEGDEVPSVVAFLEELIAMARAGKIRGIAVATVSADHGSGTAYEIGDGDAIPLVYGLERLKLRLLSR